MKQGNLSLKVVYRPLNTYKNVVVVNGSNRQNYNANTRYFEPDRRIDPYVVRVECGVNDPHNIVNGLVNDKLTDVVWKISDAGTFTVIELTNKDFVIGTGVDKGQLKVYKNVSDLEAVTIVFTARYMEPKTKRVVNYQESFTLITLPIATAPIVLETAAPVGYNLVPTENNQGLLCTANLVQGIEKLPAAYWWYKGDTLLTDANGYQGTATKKLFIPADKLSKAGDVFKCEVADCTDAFNDLVQQKVDADVQVIEWRRLYQQYGENLENNSNYFGVDWYGYSGAIIDRSINFEIPEFNTKQATKFNSNKGTHLIKLLKAVSTTVSTGDIYSYSYHIKNIGQNIIVVYSNNSNIPMYDIAPGKSQLVKVENWIGNGQSHMYVQIRAKNVNDALDFALYKFKYEKGSVATPWSPSKQDLQNLIAQKTEYYKEQTSLPEGYRPTPKPAKLYKGDYMLMKQMPVYNAEVLYPREVSPDSKSVQVEMVLNTNQGIIQDSEKLFSVGWLKKEDGSFKYKGFKVNIAIADIIALNEANKELDYELREDLTLKV